MLDLRRQLRAVWWWSVLTFLVSVYGASEADERNVAQKLFGAIQTEHEKIVSELSRRGWSISAQVQVVVGEVRARPTPSGMKQATAEAVTDGPLYDMDGKSREATAAARWDLIFEEPK